MSNNLTRFESEVFKYVLEKIEPSGGYPDAYVGAYNSKF